MDYLGRDLKLAEHRQPPSTLVYLDFFQEEWKKPQNEKCVKLLVDVVGDTR